MSLRGEVRFTSTRAISAISSVNSSGADTAFFAAPDHQHAGISAISIIGNTAGDAAGTLMTAGSIVFVGGSQITASAAGSTLNLVGPVAQPFSTSRWMVGTAPMASPPSNQEMRQTTNAYAFPVVPRAQVSVSSLFFAFQRTMASSTDSVSGANTLSFAIYSVSATALTGQGTLGSVASGSVVFSHSYPASPTSTTLFFSGARTTVVPFAASFILNPASTYVIWFQQSLAGSGSLSFMGVSAGAAQGIDPSPWTSTSSARIDYYPGVPGYGTLASTAAVPATIAFTDIISSNAHVVWAGFQ